MTWLARQRRRFLPSRWLINRDRVERVLTRGRQEEWLVGRGLCVYTCLDLSLVPLAKRTAYVRTAVRRLAPFLECDSHWEFAGTRAMVWMWDRAAVAEAAGSSGELTRASRVLPESLFRGARGEGPAIELLGVAEGCEARAWRDGALVASEWWPAAPDQREWSEFVRGAGFDVLPRPDIATVPLSEVAWGGGGASLQDIGSRLRAPGIAAAVGLAALVFALPLGSIARLKAQEAAIDGAMASLDEGLQSIMLARENAERDADEVQRLLALRPPGSVINAWAAMVEATPGQTWQLLEWRLLDPRTTEAVLRMQQPDLERIVAAWEASGTFVDVTAEMGRSSDEITMRATLAPAGRP